MRIHNKAWNIAFKLLLIVCGCTGLAISTGLTDGAFDISMLRMFTTLSNIACALWLIGALIHLLRGKAAPFLPGLHGALVLDICVTGLIAATLLQNMVNFTTDIGWAMFFLHVLIPIGMVADWLLFEQKGQWGRFAPIGWLIPPYVYIAFIFSTEGLVTRHKIPYPFLDYHALGLGAVVWTVAALTVGFLLLGLGLRFLDRRLDRTPAQKLSA